MQKKLQNRDKIGDFILKLSKKRLFISLIPISVICVGLVQLIVEKILSKKDMLLFNVRSFCTFAAIIAVAVSIILLIIDAVKSYLKKKNCFSRLLMIMTAVSIILCGSLYILINEDNKPYHTININWDMRLPNHYKETYYKENTSSVMGNGLRFSIFEYENSDEIKKAVKWTDGNDVKEIAVPIITILDSLHVDYDKYPDLNGNYKYYHQNKDGNSDIYLITNDEYKKIYIIENLN